MTPVDALAENAIGAAIKPYLGQRKISVLQFLAVKSPNMAVPPGLLDIIAIAQMHDKAVNAEPFPNGTLKVPRRAISSANSSTEMP